MRTSFCRHEKIVTKISLNLLPHSLLQVLIPEVLNLILKMFLPFVHTILILLSFSGGYALWVFASNNGTYELMADASKTMWSNPKSLPSITSIHALDENLKFLISFYWPFIDGSRPDVSLHAVDFAIQYTTFWLLLVMEALRAGNSWKAVSL